MHQQMQQSVDGLHAMRIRLNSATAELFSMIGKELPAAIVKFQVVAKGVGAYHIVEVSTGKVRGFRFSFARAVEYAKALEHEASCRGRPISIE